METSIAVSVIIPVYNAEPYLRECLDSVVSQTLRDIEIICVDDGSTDASLDILREYETSDSRIRVLSQPHTNAGAARNCGLDLGRGEYLSFLDADDFFEPEMLERAYKLAEQQSAEILVFRCNDYNTEEDRYLERPNCIEKDWLPESQPFAGTELNGNLFLAFVGWAWDKLLLREYIQKNNLRFQEQRTTNDLYFTYFALAQAERIVTMDDVLAHHRVHLNTSLEATREKSWDCFYRALYALRDGLRRKNLFGHFERDFVNYVVSFSLWHLQSLPWPTQEALFYLMKNSWLQELGITEHGETYFDNKEQYRQISAVLSGEYSEVFPSGSPIGGYQAELEKLAGEVAEKDAELKRLYDENARKTDELERMADESAAIRASATYKIGRLITYVPRKLRGGYRCLKENGFLYTGKRLLEKACILGADRNMENRK